MDINVSESDFSMLQVNIEMMDLVKKENNALKQRIELLEKKIRIMEQILNIKNNNTDNKIPRPIIRSKSYT